MKIIFFNWVSFSQESQRGTKAKKTAQGGKGIKLVPINNPDYIAGMKGLTLCIFLFKH